MNPYVGYDNIVPLLAPVDMVTTAVTCPYMSLKNAQRAAFIIPLGVITSTTATDALVVTVQAATAEGGTEAAVAFNYRLSGAVGANTWGAVTTADTTGVTIASTDDAKILYIELDPDALAASDYAVARVVITDTPDIEGALVAVLGVIQARYKQTTHISATASASA